MDKKKDISLIVRSLQSKVEKLVLQHRKSTEEVKSLKEENDFLRKTLAVRKEELKEFEGKNKVLKIAKSIGGDEVKNTDIKLKINELVREIDKCIAMVNN